MKLTLRRPYDRNARLIAELHRRLILAHQAVKGILEDTPDFGRDGYPLTCDSQDAVLRLLRSLEAAGFSLETPFHRVLGDHAPLSSMEYAPDHWLTCVEKFERETTP